MEGAQGQIDELTCEFINLFTPDVCACQPLELIEKGESVIQVPDIVSVAMGAGSFNQLLNALEVTGLVQDFYGPKGLYTVFAPLDSAFDALPEGIIDILLQPQNLELLTDIVLYHIVAREMYSTDFVNGVHMETMEGGSLTVSKSGGLLSVNAAAVVATDIMASNGVIHVLDQVLLPDSFLEILPTLLSNATGSMTDLDIPTIATMTGSFDVLLAALNTTDLLDTLSDPEGPYTIFAPVDAAFEALPMGLLDWLLKPQYTSFLADVLKYHVVNGTYTEKDLVDGMIIPTLYGDTLTVTTSWTNETDSLSTFINDALIIDPNIFASNGVMHAISNVLLPTGFSNSKPEV